MYNNNGLPRLNTLWVGGKLSYIEQLCLKSGLDAGHDVRLYTYYGVENVPEGVEVRDGREILPEERLLKNRQSGSYALGSDLFRYQLMLKEKGYWIDTDIYVLKPMEFNSDYIFGFEDCNYINGAVLYIPKNSELLTSLINYIYSKPIIAPWWSRRKRSLQKMKSLFNIDRPLSELGWGIIGPKAITYFVKELKLDGFAKTKDVFYPVHYRDAHELFEPASNEVVLKQITNETCTVHLWNEKIKELKQIPPKCGSYIHNVCNQHGINFVR